MTALEEIKKAFPNMFRPLKWHHFDGPTEHGCGEWYAHATRGMYHIYDVREKFPNDRPFYAKELSDQFDTLEQAQDAVQNRHELDIVMCLDPDFRSTLSAQVQDVVGSHPDDLAVDRFALAMKAKLAQKRAEGRGGWDNPDECSVEWLSELLIRHIKKGDPIDVGNFAMMIHQRGGRISR